MNKRYIHGVPALTINEAVDNFMALQGNAKRHHNITYLIAAKWAWKDLLKSTIWNVRQHILPVDPVTKSISLPDGVSRLLSISLLDEKSNIRPLYYNAQMNTLDITCGYKKASCDKCNGSGTLCDAIDAITYRTENVKIENQLYVKRIYNRVEDNGTLYEYIENPEYDTKAMGVVYNTIKRTVCKFDVNEDGCVTLTDENSCKLSDNCGAYILTDKQPFYEKYSPETPEPNEAGYWKPDANNPSIIHINTPVERVIVAFQTNGEDFNAGEMILPESAFQVFASALQYYITMYKPRTPLSEKRDARLNYEAEKKDYMKFQNPVNLNDFANLSGTVKW